MTFSNPGKKFCVNYFKAQDSSTVLISYTSIYMLLSLFSQNDFIWFGFVAKVQKLLLCL